MRPGLVIILLAGGVNGPSAGKAIGRLSGGMDGIIVDTSTEVYTTGIFIVVIDLERATADTEESMAMPVGIMLDVLIAALLRTVNRDVSDIRVSADVDTKMCVAVMAVPASSEELLLFRWTAFCTCPITILDCCALQAWMPSYHVC